MIPRPLAALIQAYPSETHLQDRLRDLTPHDRAAAVDHFSLILPEFDVIIALPDAEAIARGLAHLRGTPVLLARFEQEPFKQGPSGQGPSGQDEGPLAGQISPQPGRWTLPRSDLPSRRTHRAVLVTQHLQAGLTELLVATLAVGWGWTVDTVAVVVERTNARGRTRLELQGMTVRAALQLADTPSGLQLERRFPHLN